MAYFKTVSQHMPGETKKTTEISSNDNQLLGQESNLVPSNMEFQPPKYNTEETQNCMNCRKIGQNDLIT
jgi:hypothetical protein